MLTEIQWLHILYLFIYFTLRLWVPFNKIIIQQQQTEWLVASF